MIVKLLWGARRIAPLIIIILLFAVVGGSQAQVADETALTTARQLLQLLVAEDYAGAEALFDAPMTAAMPRETLQETWETGIIGQVGVYQEELAATVEPYNEYKIVTLTAQFEQLALDVQVTVNPDGTVGGLFFRPNFNPPGAETPTLPDYIDPTAFTETEINIGGDANEELPGTLALPVGDGTFPAVVLVHGSGPNDRDETIGPNKPFRDIAQGLASHGIAVLRYDKRTLIYPEQFIGALFTVEEETINDAALAVALLREMEMIDGEHIFVLGHSLGGLVAPRIGAADPNIAGLIIAAGNTRPLEDLILEQTLYLANLDGQVTEEETIALADAQTIVTTVRALTTTDAANTDLIFGAPPVYWLDLHDYDPIATAQAYPNPLLILQGERDYQVTLVDFAGWQTGLSERDDVTFITYPALNHLFMTGEGASSPTEYFTPGYVDAEVVMDIIEWVLANSGS